MERSNMDSWIPPAAALLLSGSTRGCPAAYEALQEGAGSAFHHMHALWVVRKGI